MVFKEQFSDDESTLPFEERRLAYLLPEDDTRCSYLSTSKYLSDIPAPPSIDMTTSRGITISESLRYDFL
jgi:hypothetical protein